MERAGKGLTSRSESGHDRGAVALRRGAGAARRRAAPRAGAPAAIYDNLQTAKHRELHDLDHATSLPGPIARVEDGAATGDHDVDTNYALLGWTYDCYASLYGRDSFNDAGAKLISSVHYGNNYVNAFWNGTQMVDGDGDGVSSISLASRWT